MNIWLKIAAWITAGSAAAVGIAALTLNRPFAKEAVKNTLENLLSSETAQFHFKKLSGDVFNDITLDSVYWVKVDTVLFVPKVRVTYRWQDFLRGNFEIDSLIAQSPEVSLYWDRFTGKDGAPIPDKEEGGVSVFIRNLSVRNASGFIEKIEWFPEGPLRFQKTAGAASFSMKGSFWHVSLQSVQGLLTEPRISETMQVESAGDVTTDSVRLPDILVQAGKNVMHASSEMALSETGATGKVHATGKKIYPELWRPLKGNTYVQSAGVRLDLGFTPESLALTTRITTADTDSIILKMDFSLLPDLTLHRAHLEIKNLRNGVFLKDSGIRSIRSVSGQFSGNLSFTTPELAEGNFSARAVRIAPDGFPIVETVQLDGVLQGDAVSASVSVKTAGQTVVVSSDVKNIYSETPDWNGTLQFTHINPGFWMQDTAYFGKISGTASASGKGFTPGKEQFSGKLNFSTLILKSFSFTRLDNTFSSKNGLLKVKTVSSAVGAQLEANSVVRFLKTPSYSVRLDLNGLDLAEILPEVAVSTNLRGSLSLQGTGITPGKMSVYAEIALDSSIVAGERLDQLQTRFQLTDSVAVIDNGSIKADFAEGIWQGEVNIFNLVDLRNRVQASVVIHNLIPFRPLSGIPDLDASGSLSLSLKQPSPGELQVSAMAKFKDLTAMQFRVGRVELQSDGTFRDSLLVSSRAEFTNIDHRLAAFQSVEATSQASWSSGPVRGTVAALFIPNGESRVRVAGDFSKGKDLFTVLVRTVQSEYRDFSLNSVKPFRVYVSDSASAIESLRLSGKDDVSIELAAHLKNDTVSLNATLREVSLERISKMLSLRMNKMEGIVNTDFTMQGKDKTYIYAGSASVRRFRYLDFRFDSVFVAGSGTEQLAELQGGIKHRDTPLVLLYGTLPLPGAPVETAFNIRLVSELPSFDPLRDLLDTGGIQNLGGALRLRLNGTGTVAKPAFSGQLLWTEASLGSAGIDSLHLKLLYSDAEKRMNFVGTSWLEKKSLAAVSGYLPVSIDLAAGSVSLPSEQDSVRIQFLSEKFDLAAFTPFLTPLGVGKIGGSMSASIKLSGTASQPALTGSISLDDGAFSVLPLNTNYSGMQIRARLTPEKLLIERVVLKGERGDLAIKGELSMKGVTPDALNIHVLGNQLELSKRNNLRLFAGADLSVGGTLNAPEITGNITIQEMMYQLSGFGTSTLEDVSRETDEPMPEFDVYTNSSADIRIIVPESISRLGQRVLIKNKSNPELELRLLGELNIVKKSGEDTHLFGTIETASGFARQFAKKFDVTRGKLTFSGPLDDAALDIETMYSINRENVSIYFRLGGTIKEPKFTYESDPAMDTQDIISYTMFGRPFGTLMGWEQSVAGTSTKMAAGDVVAESATALLIEKAGELAGAKLGIDIVEIDNSNRTTGGGTTIKAGKFINDKTMLAVIQQLGGTSTTQFTLEYQLKRNLQLILTQSQDSRTGVDILWRKEY